MASVLAIDVGGSHVKALVSGEREPRRADSGPAFTPQQTVESVKELAEGWRWEVVSVGVPTPVHGGRIVHDPVNLGAGWVGFDFASAFGKPTAS
jgi:polyphosphate glucokinase